MRALEHIDRHFRIAAELARQRPFGAGAIGEDAAEHAGTGRRARHLLDFLDGVDGIERYAESEGARDIALLLDRVTEGDAVGRGPGGKRHLDFGHRRRVKARAETGEQRQDLRRRIGFHRIENAGSRHGAGEAKIVGAHDFEIDDEAGAFGSSGGEEVENASGGHCWGPPEIKKS